MSVYLINVENTDYYKIGSAVRPYERLAALQLANPHKLRITRVIDGDRRHEKRIQTALKPRLVRGEWYDLPECPTEEELYQLAGDSRLDDRGEEYVTSATIPLMLGLMLGTPVHRHPEFPSPIGRVDRFTPVWNRADVIRWAENAKNPRP